MNAMLRITGLAALAVATVLGCSASQNVDDGTRARIRLDHATQIGIEEQHAAFLRSQLPLHVKWTTSVLGGEYINWVQLTDRELLVVTGTWGLYSLNRETGVVNWFLQLRGPIARQGSEQRQVPFAVAGDFLYVLYHGDVLGAIWRSSGRPRWLKRITEFTPGSFLAANDFYCFVGSIDKHRVYAIRESDQQIAWDFGTNDSVVAAPVQSDPTVYFSDLDGATYAANVANGKESWKHQSARGTRADLYVKGGRLYVGSLDHALYGLDRFSGRPDWVFETGGPIEAPAQEAGRALDPPDRFGIKGEPTLFAIDSEKGTERWRLRRGERLLFHGEKFAYVLREGGVMVIVEDDSGRVRAPSLELDGYPLADRFPWMLTNDQDDVLFLATRDGFFFAMQEQNPNPYK
ncbi:MAG: outer membrane protein assembly factor BamB family protein [Planctomycetota bacterium]|jgi:outer membrane protein assembly factor BamB